MPPQVSILSADRGSWDVRLFRKAARAVPSQPRVLQVNGKPVGARSLRTIRLQIWLRVQPCLANRREKRLPRRLWCAKRWVAKDASHGLRTTTSASPLRIQPRNRGAGVLLRRSRPPKKRLSWPGHAPSVAASPRQRADNAVLCTQSVVLLSSRHFEGFKTWEKRGLPSVSLAVSDRSALSCAGDCQRRRRLPSRSVSCWRTRRTGLCTNTDGFERRGFICASTCWEVGNSVGSSS